MILSEYIEKLQELMELHGGDLPLYTAIDDEGNGFNEVYYDPCLRLLSPTENEGRPDNLIMPRNEDDETVEEWCDNNYLDYNSETDSAEECLKKVILL